MGNGKRKRERWVGPAMDRAKRRLPSSTPRRSYYKGPTAERRRRKRVTTAEIRAAITELKRQPCADCGGTYDPVCMDFDHRPGETKLRNVATLANYSYELAMAEIAKCDLVCANCHRLRTKNRGWPKQPNAVEPVDSPQLGLFAGDNKR